MTKDIKFQDIIMNLMEVKMRRLPFRIRVIGPSFTNVNGIPITPLSEPDVILFPEISILQLESYGILTANLG